MSDGERLPPLDGLGEDQRAGDRLISTDAPEAGGALEPSRLALSPIAGFWRRFAAFGVDSLLLGIFGQAVGWPFATFWFEIGPYGRVLGALIALLYFGLLESHLANGQTLGGLLLKVAVRDRHDRPIGVGRSMLRTLIWTLPLVMNGWELPVLATPVLSWLSIVVVFGLGGALLFTMVFNRRTRQGLHDMACDTYVVATTGERVASFPAPPRLQWIAPGAIVGLAVGLATVGQFVDWTTRTSLEPLVRLQRALLPDPRFFSVGVWDQTFTVSGGQATHILRIDTWFRGLLPDSERVALVNQVAKVALVTIDDVDQYDLLRVNVASKFDLGIATGHVTYGDGEPIATWRERVGD